MSEAVKRAWKAKKEAARVQRQATADLSSGTTTSETCETTRRAPVALRQATLAAFGFR
jgi:hypothetical protein